jgi:hypothetical protein
MQANLNFIKLKGTFEPVMKYSLISLPSFNSLFIFLPLMITFFLSLLTLSLYFFPSLYHHPISLTLSKDALTFLKRYQLVDETMEIVYNYDDEEREQKKIGEKQKKSETNCSEYKKVKLQCVSGI